MRLAFIGLGKMGSAMARNLLRAGHQLNVYNRSRDKAEPLAADGARIAASPADACRDVEIAFSMLSDDHAALEVTLGADGILNGLHRGAIHASSSTVSTACSRKLAEEHARRGQHYLAATVFGRPEAAQAAKLVVIAAGDPDVLERAMPAFDAIGRQTIIAGAEPWQANAVKLCGNFMIAAMLETFGEAFAVMRKSAIDPHVFLDAMTALFQSPVYSNYGKAIADAKFEPAGFELKLGAKDVRLALAAAEECGAPLPVASLLRDHFLSALAHGQEHQDWSSISQVSARAAGL